MLRFRAIVAVVAVLAGHTFASAQYGSSTPGSGAICVREVQPAQEVFICGGMQNSDFYDCGVGDTCVNGECPTRWFYRIQGEDYGLKEDVVEPTPPGANGVTFHPIDDIVGDAICWKEGSCDCEDAEDEDSGEVLGTVCVRLDVSYEETMPIYSIWTNPACVGMQPADGSGEPDDDDYYGEGGSGQDGTSSYPGD